MPLAPAVRTQLMRASPGLGGAPLGNLFRAVTDDTAMGTIRHALDAGSLLLRYRAALW